MPTYQYECAACSHSFEIVQPISAKRLSICPQCKKRKLSRLIGSGSGIIFKGSGFYETDYKKKAPTAESKPETKESPSETPSGKTHRKDCSGTCGCAV